MGIEKLVFYVFSTIAIFAAVMVVVNRNPVKSVLFLVLSFFSMAGVWLLLQAEFLAITLVLVYVGAVMVLFLFVVMMLDIDIVAIQGRFAKFYPLALVAALATMFFMYKYLGPQNFGLDEVVAPPPHAADYSNVKALGSVLYTDYVVPFELAAVLLLVAIIAAISLTFRGRVGSKGQKPGEQVQTSKAARLKIVKMTAEKPD